MYRAALTGSVSRAVIAHFFAGILCGSQHPEALWRKKQRNVDKTSKFHAFCIR
ncbi:TPA: hypothetical protein MCR62_004383 [Klebsiella pneumoniae]|nr:hypothetical protein [Klebsiella pneumoniae]HBU1528215.1 hypothetical protein [Klebsiella pneumoniae]HBW7224768.1 hypothetical protein [Klebsiella pneumoniae]